MNEKVIEILEFKKIKEKIANYTATELGHNSAMKIEPEVSIEKIQKLIDETFDGATIVRLNKTIPIRKLSNIDEQLKRLKMDAVLSGTELSLIALQLKNVEELKRFFEQLIEEEKTIEFRKLPDIFNKLVIIPELNDRLKTSITDTGAILDSASIRLGNIRASIKILNDKVRQLLEKSTHGNNAKYLSESLITIRDERFVLPVKAEYKAKFGGIIHDQSASGQTLYIEPANVVELNNDISQKKLDEKNEIQNILRELSDLIRPYSDDLRQNHWILSKLDLINAKAKYAAEIKATEPNINADRIIELRQARHPLLNIKDVVANDIKLGEDYSTIVITGPNTGGKTITLKTLGLLQMMGQAGLFIPANENSQIAVFDEIFADIGDEQSIEQNLSTFSSHITNIVDIFNNVNDRSLVLFDELGAGTDPQEGAALAISIIEQLIDKHVYTVATSHYPELKLFAYENSQTINASMEFNIDTLRPTYKFLIGVPGSSNAIEIAERLGLSKNIIDDAKMLIGDQSQELNNMIKSLEDERKQFVEGNEKLAQKIKENDSKQESLDKQLLGIDKLKEDTLIKANRKADELIAKAVKQADKIISELRQLQLNGSTVKEDQLISAKTGLNKLRPDPALLKNKVLKRAKSKQEIRVGDEVKVLTYGQIGTVLNKRKDGEYEVQLGILKMKVALDDLEKIQTKDVTQPKKIRSTVKRTTKAVSGQVDLRGLRYDEAMDKMGKYLDQALLQGYGQVTIVHGRGTGAIRNGVTEYLKTHRQVKHFEFAPDSAGGTGATIVEFK
ncbi:endonuclease MutS2 [Companilactobacillus sp. RD055328]|uniref:endonuclease MutS2 n=1 Tax=Companilactobacillus sp. RD055328 TaxID=2916634 RepID=UPI001FC8298C|nr:endonuclease MutS2 [Companilactobacillus sp. RD055328]GKQ42096.1 endonuclease MutS2 [Companilactobacillus sp. RD055328]